MEVNEEKRSKFMEFAGKSQWLEVILMILQNKMLKKCF